MRIDARLTSYLLLYVSMRRKQRDLARFVEEKSDEHKQQQQKQRRWRQQETASSPLHETNVVDDAHDGDDDCTP